MLLAQGRRVRKTVPRLPEAAGPRAGTVGTGPVLRLLIVGDSAAAGVGAETQADALCGQLVSLLAPDRTVTYRLEATTGHTSADCVAALRTAAPAVFDLAVTSLGVNDATALRSTSRFLADQRQLLTVLRDRFAVRHVLLGGLPPVGRFPALPWPLRAVIGAYADRLHEALAGLAAQDPDVGFVDLRAVLTLSEADMARDGFHPGPAVYAAWARLVADQVRRLDLG